MLYSRYIYNIFSILFFKFEFYLIIIYNIKNLIKKYYKFKTFLL